jgi:hypothetical protein
VGGLAVIPFDWVVRAIRADDTVLGRDRVPEVRVWSAGCSDPMHVDGKPIGVKRLELIDKSSDTERRRPISGKNSSLS